MSFDGAGRESIRGSPAAALSSDIICVGAISFAEARLIAGLEVLVLDSN